MIHDCLEFYIWFYVTLLQPGTCLAWPDLGTMRRALCLEGSFPFSLLLLLLLLSSAQVGGLTLLIAGVCCTAGCCGHLPVRTHGGLWSLLVSVDQGEGGRARLVLCEQGTPCKEADYCPNCNLGVSGMPSTHTRLCELPSQPELGELFRV